MPYDAVNMADWQISEAAEKNMPTPGEWRDKLGLEKDEILPMGRLAKLDFLKIIRQEAQDERNFVKKAVNWALRQIGKRNRNLHRAALITAEEIKRLERLKEEVKPDDILTIMYTSGTSGEPKGTILTHHNMVSNILFTLAAFPLQASKRVMSYLPFSHILERSACYAYLSRGASIYFVQNKDSFLADFKSARPYFSTSVPKVLERMYDYLQEQTLAQSWLKRTITIWSIKTAQAYNNDKKKRVLLFIKLFFA